MTATYNLTGPERKALVTAVSQLLETPAEYLRAPSYAYQVGEYRIDRSGTLTGPDNRGLAVGLAGLHSLTAASVEYDTNPAEETNANADDSPEFEDLELTEREELGLGRERKECPQGENGMLASDIPETEAEADENEAGTQAHETEAENETAARTYRVELDDPERPGRTEQIITDEDLDAVYRAYGMETDDVSVAGLFETDSEGNTVRSLNLPQEPDYPSDGYGKDGGNDEADDYNTETTDTTNSDGSGRLTVEIPLDGFTPEKLENLNRLVAAKATLIKAAIGTENLPIQLTGETIRFPWFPEGHSLNGDEALAYSTLVSLLCKTAKEKKRVTAKEKPLEGSPKYAMRCFLLSLGMIGAEYKAARKTLLSKLEGNSSWKNGLPDGQPETTDKVETTDVTEATETADAGASAVGQQGNDSPSTEVADDEISK